MHLESQYGAISSHPPGLEVQYPYIPETEVGYHQNNFKLKQYKTSVDAQLYIKKIWFVSDLLRVH